MREIKISLDTATRWYNGTDEELKGLALTTYPELAKKELPKTWEELGEINGYYTHSISDICYIGHFKTNDSRNKNVFATKEQAEASIALAQLSQLREVYRNGWTPDWNKVCTKYVIVFDEGKIYKAEVNYQDLFLSFQDAETRDLFLENFATIIEQAKPLMS